MKKRIVEVFVCMLLIGTCFVVTSDMVSAEDLVEGDYKYTVSNGEATITGYIGAGGAITIPSTLGGYRTVFIGDNAFYNQVLITSVIIPSNVTAIGDMAFSNCYYLTNVTIPNSVTTIGDHAFSNCYYLTNMTIPNRLTTIGDSAFISCTSLTAINVDAANVKYYNFEGVLYNKAFTTLILCPGGKAGTVHIPDSVTAIGDGAFSYCYYLTNVTIPNSVTTIGDHAFYDCYSMTTIDVSASNANYASVDGVLYNNTITTLILCPGGKAGTVHIPDSVITIGDGAFSNCYYLTNVTIPNSVTTIGDHAFYDCYSMTTIDVSASNANYASLDGVLYDKASKTLILCPGGKAGTVHIPDSVTTIGDSAFISCTSLTNVTIPNSVTTIGDSAFISCSNLASITFQGLVAPTTVGSHWIEGTPVGLRGHAYANSDFPAPEGVWHGLTMGTVLSSGGVGTPGFELVFVIGAIAVAMFLWKKKRNV
jgi:hypothetical protein